MSLQIYKIFTESQWLEFKTKGIFKGSPVDLKDGYIHLSRAEQVTGVIQRYYEGIRPLFVAAFESENFGKAVSWEPSSSKELFPHLYGKPLVFSEIQNWHRVEN